MARYQFGSVACWRVPPFGGFKGQPKRSIYVHLRQSMGVFLLEGTRGHPLFCGLKGNPPKKKKQLLEGIRETEDTANKPQNGFGFPLFPCAPELQSLNPEPCSYARLVYALLGACKPTKVDTIQAHAQRHAVLYSLRRLSAQRALCKLLCASRCMCSPQRPHSNHQKFLYANFRVACPMMMSLCARSKQTSDQDFLFALRTSSW